MLFDSQCGKNKISLSPNNIPWNQVFINFLTKNDAFTNFLSKMCERNFPKFSHSYATATARKIIRQIAQISKESSCIINFSSKRMHLTKNVVCTFFCNWFHEKYQKLMWNCIPSQWCSAVWKNEKFSLTKKYVVKSTLL